nr:MAG TPA: hypothetical protein [Caudoviricetes sp.]
MAMNLRLRHLVTMRQRVLRILLRFQRNVMSMVINQMFYLRIL